MTAAMQDVEDADSNMVLSLRVKLRVNSRTIRYDNW